MKFNSLFLPYRDIFLIYFMFVITCSGAHSIRDNKDSRTSYHNPSLNEKKSILRRRMLQDGKISAKPDDRKHALQKLTQSFHEVIELAPEMSESTAMDFSDMTDNMSREEEREQDAKEELARFFVKAHNENGKNYAAEISHEVLNHFEDNLIVVKLDGAGVRALKEHNDIGSIDEDYPIYPLSVSEKKQTGASFALMNDLMDGQVSEDGRMLRERTPYGISMIQADLLEAGEHNVTVCIIDSGVALEHPDIDASLLTGDNNNRTSSSLLWNRDLDGHGTHVAGTMTSLIGNGQGIRGIGKIHVHVTRGLDDDGGGFESDVRQSIDQCVKKGADVISLSLGGHKMSTRMNRTYTELVHKHGIMLFGASGNDGETKLIYPAAHPDAISVGAVDHNGRSTYFSNYNDQVELAAPGLNILSTSISNIAIYTTDFSYPAYQASTTAKNINGDLKYCGYGTEVCDNAEGKICLVRRKDAAVADIVQNCIEGNAIGVIIFWEQGYGGSWLGVDSTIPVLVVDQTSGYELIFSMLSGTSETPNYVRIGFAGVSNRLAREYTYTYYTGTSMSCPHAAAAAALVWSHFPNCSNHHVRYALAYTASNQGREGCDEHYGYGIVQARAAYEYLLENECTDDWPKTSTGGCSTV